MIAVILPVHNGERYLAEAIESVLQQTYRAFRLIVVDDGSSDGSPAIVRRFMAQDSRVTLLRQPHAGVSVARNAALAAAVGHEWIACLDHDDLMLPARLERQLAFAEAHPGVAAFAALAFYITESGTVIGQTVPAPIRSQQDLDRFLTTGELIGFNQPSVMMRRDAVLAVGGYHPEMRVGQDLDLWMRLAQAGHLLLQQDEILTKYRMHRDSATAKRTYESHLTSQWVSARAAARRAGRAEPTRAEFEAAWRSRPLHERLAEHRRHLGWVYYRRAGAALPNGETAKGLAWLVAASCLRPWYVAERMRHQLGQKPTATEPAL